MFKKVFRNTKMTELKVLGCKFESTNHRSLKNAFERENRLYL